MAGGEQQQLLPKCDDVDVQLSVRDAILSTPKRRVTQVHRGRSCAILRADVWTLLHYRTSLKQRSGLQRASYVFEVCVLVLITLNVVLAMLKWMLRPMSVIDLVVLIPFYLEILLEHQLAVSSRGVMTLRGFRLLRIMSFLHLERSYQAMKNLREIFALKKEELAVVSYLTIVIVLTSSTTIFFLENPAQPEVFTSIGTCSWWAIETITSLGYGDIVPITAAGRAFSSLLALWGIILFTIPGAILGSGFVEVMLKKQEQKNELAMEESIRTSLTRELRTLSSSNILYTDPHEEKQKALLQRITGSVARLHEVIKEINTQIELNTQDRGFLYQSIFSVKMDHKLLQHPKMQYIAQTVPAFEFPR
ncbi:Voltage-gated Ion Channel (VIC) Superfamily [Phytophthora infestans T30-4]|uniref:Voltage-gated Ion Channel (VIC) Superfamily n=1 Tax=Phytophthora infestans (strain T30-4) TaxID=403677 RepID=D0NUZ5_PHYIT|nr:Voltage-gated Ion Channel (VIC) Superfamily [Phytophthora infestans T30-4]EEY66467.1 Voltage-gated Ion Channel (VIC) Superfamily [Phytophthora infestans T30-4]|eukprot:XP_002896986.1 Voltage-gated Ion Channel (VIC) Superfamily [Phytophthora infestans T30-4]